jgi:hypothetical protein
VLPVGVDGNGQAEPAPPGLEQAGGERRPLAEVARVAHHLGPARPGHFRRGVARAVVYHEDRKAERPAQIVDHGADRVAGVERGHQRARGLHDVSFTPHGRRRVRSVATHMTIAVRAAARTCPSRGG